VVNGSRLQPQITIFQSSYDSIDDFLKTITPGASRKDKFESLYIQTN